MSETYFSGYVDAGPSVERLNEEERSPDLGGQVLTLGHLDDRSFEVLAWRIKRESVGASRARLMQGTGERGRDVVVYTDGRVETIVQCKLLSSKLDKPAVVRELLKVVLHGVLDPNVLGSGPVRYELWAPGGFTEPAEDLLRAWPASWTADTIEGLFCGVRDEYTAFAELTWEGVRERIVDVFPKVLHPVAVGTHEVTALIRDAPAVHDAFFVVHRAVPVEQLRDILREERQGRERLHQDHREILSNQEMMLGMQGKVLRRVGASSARLGDEHLDTAEKRFDSASESLLTWPTTTAGVWLDRPELDQILGRIAGDEATVTLVEGDRGTGKSALLSVLAQRMKANGVTVVAIKADRLPLSLVDADNVVPDVPGGCVRGIRELAARQPVAVVLDQLDALSDVSDIHPGRLNAVLDLISRLRGAVSVVASVRPFERSVDTRLQSSFREVVVLAPAAWETVEPVLAAGGHDTLAMTDALRGLLRVPEFLRVYLHVAAPSQAYGSWHRLYDDYWQRRVLSAHPEAAPLVSALVDWMGIEEALWAPSSVADVYPEAYTALLREDVLVSDCGRIGFRHQTLFEFARARRFACGEWSLVEHVRDRENGLFVRPVLIAGLTALRDASPSRYQEALVAFTGGAFRPHIEQLVSEYVAAQETPTDEEREVLLPKLDGPLARQTFAAIRRSPGWFRVLVQNEVLSREMMRPPEEALGVLGILVAASKRGEGETVFRLVQEHWLGDPAYDEYALSALDEIPSWPPDVTRVIMANAPRFSQLFRHHIVLLGLKGDARAGFDALKADLDRDTEAAFAVLEGTYATSTSDTRVAAMYREQARGRVLRDWHHWPTIATYVAGAPAAFVETVWPWFEAALLDESATQDRVFMYRGPLVESGWDDDERDRTMIGVATRMLTALGEADEVAFVTILNRLAGDSRMRIHRVLIRTLAALAGRDTEQAVTYLLSDPRRLLVSSFGSEVGETVALLRALSPHLSAKQRDALESAIRTFAPVRPDDEDEVRWTGVTERARLRLMRGVEDPSDTFKTDRESAERVYPDLPDETRIETGFSAVLAPVPASRLADMDANAWHEVIDRVLSGDAAALTKDHHEAEVSAFHMGAAEEQASAFGDAAKAAPDRAWEVLGGLTDVRYEPFVTELIGGIGASPSDAATSLLPHMPETVARFDAAGFETAAFRYRASDALRHVHDGLSDDTLTLLEKWFWEAEVSTLSISDSHDDRVSSLLFGSSTLILGGGSGNVLEALAAGCFYRPQPAFDWWAAFLHRIADAQPHPKTAAAAIRLSGDLFASANLDRARATDAFVTLVRSSPEAAMEQEGIVGLGGALRHLSPLEAALDVVDRVRGLAWGQAEQAYGELIVALHVGSGSATSEERIQDAVREGGDALRGLAFAAAALWMQSGTSRPLMLRVLQAAIASGDTYAAGASRRVFLSFAMELTPREWTPQDDGLVRAVIGSDDALKAAFEGVLSACQHRIRLDPHLAGDVADAVVRAVERGVVDRWERARLDGPLVQIALTLHRRPNHRERGLLLFESVYRLGLSAAREAIQVLDRNPFRP